MKEQINTFFTPYRSEQLSDFFFKFTELWKVDKKYLNFREADEKLFLQFVQDLKQVQEPILWVGTDIHCS